MKIRELFEEFPFQERRLKQAPRTSRQLSQRSYSERIAADATRIGRGLYSGVYARESKPHDVRKVSEQHGIDGTYHYLQAIRKSGDASNPFYPKVRSMRVYKDEEGEDVAYTVEMERLRNLYELRHEEAIHMASRLFQGDWMNDVFGHQSGNDPDVGSIVSMLAVAVDTNEEFDMGMIRDPYLRRAIMLIRNLGKRHAPDIGDSNIMLRRTPYGPQLVITDPLA